MLIKQALGIEEGIYELSVICRCHAMIENINSMSCYVSWIIKHRTCELPQIHLQRVLLLQCPLIITMSEFIVITS